VDEAVAQGVNAASMSWGTAEYSTETSDDSHFNHPGIAFVASSGDYGYGTTSWPAASRGVFAVGGADLEADAYGNWYETAWAGATSGGSLYEPQPSYQHDTGCANRTMTDISADAGTAVSMFMTYPVSGWSTGWPGAGGTSASAPMVAGILVLAPQDTIVSTGPGNWYSSAYTPGAFSVNDITSGSTDSCGTYLCNAGPGYDGPTGLGSPDGIPPSANSRAAAEIYGGANTAEAGPTPCSSGEPVVCASGDPYESAVDLAVVCLWPSPAPTMPKTPPPPRAPTPSAGAGPTPTLSYFRVPDGDDPLLVGVRAPSRSVGVEGVEPPTPCASCTCSNQLSYTPENGRRTIARGPCRRCGR
jgi:hypothetical protein